MKAIQSSWTGAAATPVPLRGARVEVKTGRWVARRILIFDFARRLMLNVDKECTAKCVAEHRRGTSHALVRAHLCHSLISQ